MLDADGEADELGQHAALAQILVRKLRVRRRGRMDDERFRVADVGEDREDVAVRRIRELPSLFRATLDAKDDHAAYVYIKASEGSDNVDEMYQTNFRGAKRARIPVGSYHFFRANISPQAQLRNFMSQVNVKQQDLLPLIDVEVQPRGMSDERFRQVLDEFLRLVTREFGKRPMIYTGKNFYNKIFAGHGYNKKYKFFIACYTLDEPVLYNNDDYILWQYSPRGRAKGIRGDVDMSRSRGRHTIRDIYF